jgi:site-specific recombinase XerD
MKSGLSLTFALCQLRVRSTWHNPELGIREIMQSFALFLHFSWEAHTFVFRSRKGANRPISKVQAWRILHEAVTTNELTGKLGTHAMRNTFANRVYQQLNHDLVKTQRAMGHKNINSTVAYLSFVEDEIDQAILAS